jgi:hypothetical protein
MFTKKSNRSGTPPFVARLVGGVEVYEGKDGVKRTTFRASGTGLGGTGKAAGRMIRLATCAADLRALADAADEALAAGGEGTDAGVDEKGEPQGAIIELSVWRRDTTTPTPDDDDDDDRP